MVQVSVYTFPAKFAVSLIIAAVTCISVEIKLHIAVILLVWMVVMIVAIYLQYALNLVELLVVGLRLLGLDVVTDFLCSFSAVVLGRNCQL